MLLVRVQLAQLSPHGVMVAALDLGSSGRTGRKSSSLFVGIMLMWAQVAKGNDCKSYDIFPPGVRFPPSAPNDRNIGSTPLMIAYRIT